VANLIDVGVVEGGSVGDQRQLGLHVHLVDQISVTGDGASHLAPEVSSTVDMVNRSSPTGLDSILSRSRSDLPITVESLDAFQVVYSLL
jgi:hypothetical protein